MSPWHLPACMWSHGRLGCLLIFIGWCVVSWAPWIVPIFEIKSRFINPFLVLPDILRCSQEQAPRQAPSQLPQEIFQPVGRYNLKLHRSAWWISGLFFLLGRRASQQQGTSQSGLKFGLRWSLTDSRKLSARHSEEILGLRDVQSRKKTKLCSSHLNRDTWLNPPKQKILPSVGCQTRQDCGSKLEPPLGCLSQIGFQIIAFYVMESPGQRSFASDQESVGVWVSHFT